MHGRVAEVFNDGDEIESDFVEGQRVLFVRAKSDGRIFPAKKKKNLEKAVEEHDQVGDETNSGDCVSEEAKESREEQDSGDGVSERLEKSGQKQDSGDGVSERLEKSQQDSGTSQGTGDCSRTANRGQIATTHRAAS